MKTCTRCLVTKALEDFPPVRRGEPQLQSWCRACFAEVNVRYYRKHHDSQKARLLRNTATRRKENQANVIEYLRLNPCVDCGEPDIAVLEFDHVAEKVAAIGTLLTGGRSWARIKVEIDRCQVRCANCHRLRTAATWPAPPEMSEGNGRSPKPAPIQLRIGPDLSPRTCRVCGASKPLADFPFRSFQAQVRQWICLTCQREYAKGWYMRNRARQIDNVGRNNALRRERQRARVRLLRAELVCLDCGETNPVLLDFDHIRDKIANVSSLTQEGRSWSAIKAEIAKCEVRCANCHRRKTARELGWYRGRAG